MPQHSASRITPTTPAIRASHRLRSSWPLTPSSTSIRFGPTSETGPDPTRSNRVAVSGSCAHAASPVHSAHGSAVVAAPTTPSRITRSPRTSDAHSATASITAEHTTYGAHIQFQCSSDTRPGTLAQFRYGVPSCSVSV